MVAPAFWADRHHEKIAGSNRRRRHVAHDSNIPPKVEQAHRQPANLKTFATTAEHDNLARPADHLTGTIDGRIIHMVGDTPEFIEGKLV
jgi:hypothetical protein